ncbi:gliding motility-associated C-terminal domain-containing protein [Lutibacter oricola]|uniref:Gliding motility-associated C-terminal domain-containing protein n=1 Tax=Lutibacter oricola TaxID=762486 RepID=A0A1H3AD42_9FLAO|nr:T9SS type B sorting domain-containing protein [Lutibacter oricola]SDX27391.1 gliding motility-associated C-terminal domain-containing protein [Lutibacter oricola]
MKTKFLFILLVSLNLTCAYSQREASIWYFGVEAGLDFNSGSPIALTNGKTNTSEGSASMSDKNGNLLFYTDGRTVWNANHQIMQGGTGLLGHNSSSQSAIIVPNPIKPNIYYIFTVDEPSPSNADDDPKTHTDDGVNDGLNYSEVNMNLNGGLGAVNTSKKNIHLVTYNQNNPQETAYKCSEKITAIQHADGNSFWVITHFINKFYAFQVKEEGVTTTPQISQTTATAPIGGYLLNAIGYLKSSPNGKKIGVVHMGTRNTNEPNPKGGLVRNTGKVLLYDFNNSTGTISNPTNVISGINPYGLAFSARSKRLYISSNNYDSDGITQGSSLLQFDIERSSIGASKKIIKKNNWVAGALQLAIDKKIYRSGYPAIVNASSEYLSVINSPEKIGTACDFKESEIYLGGKFAVKGLPPFIQSLFLFSFKYEFTCLGDATHFFLNDFEDVDEVHWDFGDGTTSTDIDTYHTYKDTGTYTVTLTKTIDGEVKEPISKDVIIKNKPIILNTTHQLIQCDSYDSNPNDELGVFNLKASIDALTFNNAENFNVYFYLNDVDAEADSNNENYLPTIFQNTIPNQQVTAKITYKNSDCYSLGKVELIANPSLLLTTTNLIGCDLGDNTAEFNLAAKELEIINSLNLSSTIEVFFYATEDDVFNDIRINGTYISEEKKVYFRVLNNGTCYGAGNFDLEINYFPLINLNEELHVCKNDFPVNISATIPTALQDDYNYTWSNGNLAHNTTIINEQDISVTITHKISNCTKIKQFNIIKVDAPIINGIDVDIDKNTAFITINNNYENKFSLDNKYGIYQPEPHFSKLTPGVHTIYVKNKFACDLSSKQFYVLGFPKFFTPNNDGINDTWKIQGVNEDFYRITAIQVFDRFGKLITKIDPKGIGWNGVYNGKILPSSDYWFFVELVDKNGNTKIRKGHFSLIRS